MLKTDWMLQHQPIESRISQCHNRSSLGTICSLFALLYSIFAIKPWEAQQTTEDKTKASASEDLAGPAPRQLHLPFSHVVSLNKSVRLSCSWSGLLARRGRGVGQLGRDRPPGRRQPRDFSERWRGLLWLCWLLSSCSLLDWLQFWPPARILAQPKSCKLTCVIL